jgi:pimeloyl-ACP methyl ester carboxylesterase
MSPVETTLVINGLNLAARVHGPEDGEPVICLHGWLDSAASFERLAPLLPKLRLFCLDLPGHGLSDHRHPSACYDFVYWIPDVVAVADALGWKRFSLLGHSLGGSIACCVAATFPERVARAAFIDSLGPLSGEAEQAPERLAAAIHEQHLLHAGASSVMPDLEAASAKLKKAIAGLGPEAALTLARRGTRPVPGGLTWRHDPRLRGKSLLRLTEAHVEAFLRRVACPVLVIRPDDGWPAPAEPMRRRLDLLPDARLVRVPGVHHVHLVTPEAVAEHLSAFFANG